MLGGSSPTSPSPLAETSAVDFADSVDGFVISTRVSMEMRRGWCISGKTSTLCGVRTLNQHTATVDRVALKNFLF